MVGPFLEGDLSRVMQFVREFTAVSAVNCAGTITAHCVIVNTQVVTVSVTADVVFCVVHTLHHCHN